MESLIWRLRALNSKERFQMQPQYSDSTGEQNRTRSGTHSRRRSRSLGTPTGEREVELLYFFVYKISLKVCNILATLTELL